MDKTQTESLSAVKKLSVSGENLSRILGAAFAFFVMLLHPIIFDDLFFNINRFKHAVYCYSAYFGLVAYMLLVYMKRKSLTGRDLDRYIDKINRNRSEYYTRYTGQVWSDVHHYDLCLDSSKLTAEKCVELIKGYMKVRFDGLEF